MRVTVAGVDRSASFQPSELEAISITLMASEGQPGLGTCPVPDDAGTWEPYAGQQFRLDVDDVDIIDGFAGALTRDRQGVVSSTRLVDTITVADENVELNGYRAITWSRPAETDRARVLAFNTAFLAHLSLDTTWVLNTHLVTVPAKKYTRTESIFAELQDDLAKPTGKEMFIERGRLHWHLPTEGITSDMAIVLAEDEDRIDSFTCRSANPPERSKDPMDLATDVVAINTKGETASATDATAISRHDADGLRHQRLVEEPDASPALLASIAAAYLLEHKAERITYEGEIGPMTAEQVARIPVGCLINVTDKVWGLTSSTQRIASETIRYIHPDLFMVKVELGYPIRIRAKPPKTTPPASGVGTPRTEPFVCIPSGPDYTVYEEWWRYNMPGAGAWDNVGSGWGPFDMVADEQPSAIGGPPNANYSVFFHSYEIPAGATAVTLTMDLVLGGNFAGYAFPDADSWQIHLANWGAGPPAVFSDPQTLPPSIVIASSDTVDPTDLFPVATAATVELSGRTLQLFMTGTPYEGVPYWLGPGPDPLTQTTAYHSMRIGVQSPLVFDWIYGSPSGPCTNEPDTGQPVGWVASVGDGTTTDYTTAYPYRAGSLTVLVNGVDWTSQVSEDDPTTGEYSLAYPPPLGSTVRVRYTAS